MDGISLSVAPGESLGLVGESGCGKSTLARLILGMSSLTSGHIDIDGIDVSSVRGESRKRLRRTVQLVFQDPFSALDPRMTIGRSLYAPLSQNRIGTRPERLQRIIRALDDVGLDPSFINRFPSQCSGGQLQRVVIARALLLEPQVLVCDEPTSALDSSMRSQILNLLAALKKRYNLTLVVISHDLRVVHYLCERVAVMYLGRIVEIAESEELFKKPRHPYTRSLINASMLEEKGLVGCASARGEPPSPVAPPPGCSFHPRCPIARPECARALPDLIAISDGHQVRCPFHSAVEEGDSLANRTDMAEMR
ncbi:oligopeptide/dipeptide ABC transporter ATP-binding protein [Litchfieldella qijiaojingensis]|uniref:oligopeptide/dipeptide ABC transporter ATP-binding protein n=1 Tax=Litchfieldella qijiaojingensis TaxID=980347 RepID=UPI001E5A79F4|nr:ABC transporter ATP-binding protein [Halomonas qijiaojingensis]